MFHLDSSVGISEFRRCKGVITLKDTICNACTFRVLNIILLYFAELCGGVGFINRQKTEVEVIITVIIMIIILQWESLHLLKV